MAIFKSLAQEPDLEWEFTDGSIVKTHQHIAGAASDEAQAIGKSRCGNTKKFIWLLMLMVYRLILK